MFETWCLRPNTWDLILNALYSWYLPSDTRYLILDIWYLISDTGYLILDIWYSISDTRYLILDICYSIFDTRYLILDIWYSIYAIQILLLGYIISDFWYLTPWYLQSKTLIHVTWYLPNANWYLILTEKLSDSFYMILKPAINCKKIVSFRSCSATRSCFLLKTSLRGDLIIKKRENFGVFPK